MIEDTVLLAEGDATVSVMVSADGGGWRRRQVRASGQTPAADLPWRSGQLSAVCQLQTLIIIAQGTGC
jgi:hypothetical protein